MFGGKAMRRVSRRSLVAHKVRLVLTVISVVLGTAFVAGSFVFTDTLKHTFNGIFSEADKGVDVRVDARNASNPGVPFTLAGQIKSVPGVRAVQLEASAPLVLIGKNGKRVSTGGAPSEGTIWNPPAESIKTPPTFVAGTAPAGPGDVVINEKAAKKAKLSVGDHTKVVLPTRGVLPVTISGIYHTNTETGGYVGVEFTKAEGLQLFTDGTHVEAVSIAGASGVSEQALRDRVAKLLPSDLQAKTGDQVRKDDRDSVAKALSFVNIFLLAFGAIALIVGTFIIYNTFTMIIAQRVRELALLRAIGAARRQVRSSVLFEATLIGVVGGALGVAGGIGLAVGLRALLDALDVGLPSGALVISPRTVIVALLVGTIVTLLSAYAPARRASRTPPVAAMREEFASSQGSLRRRSVVGLVATVLGILAAIRGATIDSNGTGASLIGLGLLVTGAGVLLLAPVLSRYIIGGLGRVLARPFGPVGRLARTNSVRNPRRTAATAFALTVGLMLVSGIAVIGTSTKASINSLIDNDVRADYILSGTGDTPVPLPAVAQAAKVQGVQSMTELHPVETTINGDDQSGIGVDGPLPPIVKIDYRQGGGAVTGTSMQISQTTAKDKHWKLGDHVTLATPGGASVTETITGIYDDSQLLGGWLVSGDTYRKLTPSSRYSDFVALVKAAPGTSPASLRANLEQVTDPYYTIDIRNKQEFKGQQANQINGLLGLLYGLLGLAIVIAILGIINTLALSVVERRREIGMLRAVGLLRGQLRRTVYVESLLIAVFGAVLGLAIGLTFGSLFTHRLKDQGLDVLQIPWGQALLFLVIAAVVGVLAALWPAARAARTKPLEAIAEG
ncbi:MAG TPA: FtsX-like permease family protein [Jatrophihabitantaceae bacterium]